MKTLNDLVPKTITVDELENVKAAANYYASKYMDDGTVSIIDAIKAMHLDADRKLVSIKGWVSDEFGIPSTNRKEYEHVSLCVLADINSIGYNILDEPEAKKSSPKVNPRQIMTFSQDGMGGGSYPVWVDMQDDFLENCCDDLNGNGYDFPRN